MEFLIKGFNYILPFIWSLGFAFLCTLMIIIYFQKATGQTSRRKTSIFTLIYIGFTSITVCSVIGVIVGVVLLRRNYFSYIQFLYEGCCWAILIGIVIWKRKYFKDKIANIRFYKSEKWVFLITVLYGLVCISILVFGNIQYVFPQDMYGEIGNFYFNADIGRGISSAIGFELPHKIHPSYRLVLYPLVAPLAILFKLVESQHRMIISGYYLCLIQIIFNGLSAVLFYRIISNLKIDKKIIRLATVLFSASFSMVWLAILPETYSITLLLLLSTIYLIQKNNILAIVIGFIAITTNPMVLITFVPFVWIYVVRFKKQIIELTKKYIVTKYKVISMIAGIIILLFGGIVFTVCSKYIFKWSDLDNNLLSNIKSAVNYIITPWFIGPSFENINPYFVQTQDVNVVRIIFIVILVILGITGLVRYRKNITVISAGLTLITAFILHGIMGYGRYNGIIYTPLYGWAAILLMVLGIEWLLNKIKSKGCIVLLMICLIFAAVNIKWVISLGNTLETIEFIPKTQEQNTEFYMSIDGNDDKLIASQKQIWRYLDQKVILEGLDSYRVNKPENSISGLFNNTKWFKLYSKEDKTYINIQGEVKELNQLNEAESKFFIFGMGLRDKFILREYEGKWQLVRYEDGEILLSHINDTYIDAANYNVKGRLPNGECIEIYENEVGIFIRVENNLHTLDDSISINIPTFEQYKNNDVLRILFNEVMINITKKGPTPNFIAYPEPWYRDAAVVAMVLQKTNNLGQIEQWIKSIDKIYDEQNGNKEPDNLGQILYLQSLVQEPNIEIINQVVQEADRIRGGKSYIEGITDGRKHPVYQTRWLIYGLKSLDLDTGSYKVPQVLDSYGDLMWFDEMEAVQGENNLENNNDRWPYLYYARLNYYNEPIEFKDYKYPISSELAPSAADFDKLSIISPSLSEYKLVVPHSWSAAEMLLYLLESN